MYDLAYRAPTQSALQKPSNISEAYGDVWCIKYNPSMTVVMLFGKSCETMPLYLNGLPIAFVSGCKYLGTFVKAGKTFSICAKKPLAGFLCSANTILNVLNK